MKRINFLFFISLFALTSCGTGKQIASKPNPATNSVGTKKVKSKPSVFTDFSSEELSFELPAPEFNIIDHALEFMGTSYKYGGNSDAGIDCSGLVYTSFLSQDIPLPRSSRDMAQLGEKLDLGEVKMGDLLFFITDTRKKVINHVGLVVELTPEKIYFIHSTTSRGVIISDLAENYWNNHFVMARRIL